MVLNLSEIDGTVGYAIHNEIESLNNCKTLEELKFFIDGMLSTIDGKGRDKFLSIFSKKKDFKSAYMFVYNFLLAGDNNKVIKVR